MDIRETPRRAQVAAFGDPVGSLEGSWAGSGHSQILGSIQHMAVPVNLGGSFCGCPYDKGPGTWGLG